MKKILLGLLACAAITPVASFAGENKGWYAGGSFGTSTSDYSASDAQADFGYNPGVSVDDSDTGVKVFGGFRFNPYIGAEFGLVDLGVTKISGRVGSLASADELDAGGIYGAAVGRLPLGAGFALLGKLGLGMISGEYTCKQLCPAGGYSTDTLTVVPLAGAGAQFDFAQHFAIRVEYEHFGEVEYDENGILAASYNLLTAGFLFKF